MNTIITFTGIDARTNIGRLVELQKKYPFAEFGVLVAASMQGKENRYPDLEVIDRLKGCGLNLACHVCGTLARTAVREGFGALEAFLGDRLPLFQRVQLNISTMEDIPAHFSLKAPGSVEEIIIQQHPERPLIIENLASANTDVSVLFDASGGRGLQQRSVQVIPGLRTGVAGGLGYPDAGIIYRKFKKILDKGGAGMGFWIDMESRIRQNDWMNLDEVEKIVKQMSQIL